MFVTKPLPRNFDIKVDNEVYDTEVPKGCIVYCPIFGDRFRVLNAVEDKITAGKTRVYFAAYRLDESDPYVEYILRTEFETESEQQES
jgi:hypothetical protein